MRHCVTEHCLDAYLERRTRGPAVVWMWSLADLTVNAVTESMSGLITQLRQPEGIALPLLAALVVSSFIGYLNLRSYEVQLPSDIVLHSTLLLGALKPRYARAEAVIVALGDPVSSLLSLKTGAEHVCRQDHP